jgi:hypothetical protein
VTLAFPKCQRQLKGTVAGCALVESGPACREDAQNVSRALPGIRQVSFGPWDTQSLRFSTRWFVLVKMPLLVTTLVLIFCSIHESRCSL